MLAESLQESLNRWPQSQSGTGPQSLTHQDGDWSVTIDADKVESIGSSIREIRVNRSSIDADPIDAKVWGGQVAKNTTGLLEPLRLIEADGGRNEAILRSDNPTKKGDDAHYYEVKLAGDAGQATVNRYKADTKAGTKREAVPYSLTHEVAANLAGAIAGEE